MTSRLELIQQHFRLEGEDVIRLSTGMVVGDQGPSRGYFSVSIAGRSSMEYHRIKFGLAHGHLPQRVDHRDRDCGNNLLDNLRAATQAQNRANSTKSRRDLPQGVFTSGEHYRAAIQIRGRQVHLGVYTTPETASRIYQAVHKHYYGEFHVDP